MVGGSNFQRVAGVLNGFRPTDDQNDILKGHNTEHGGHMDQTFSNWKNYRNITSLVN